MARKVKILVFLIFLVGCSQALRAQCELIDGFGNSDPNPYWISCSGGSFTVFVQSNATFGAYTIDWGDGSPLTVGGSLVPPAFVSHVYAATIDTFNLVFTETGTGCVVNGVVVLEEPVNASMQVPIGGVTQVCAPDNIEFINSSTDVSPTTTFTWDWGDGSPLEIYDETNAGQTVTHTYLPNTVNCATQVTLTAENYCSFGNPTIASFNPVLIYDVDDAAITASDVLLCYPDTVVHFDNTTNRNCVPEGNVAQRYEYWNFGNYWGTGQDSIIDWLPFLPPNRPGYDIAFPGIGSYTVTMIDSSLCGLDTAVITINVVPPPTAGAGSNKDTICAGESVTFSNLSVGGANSFRWDFDKGGGFVNTGGGNQTETYNNPGNYTIRLVASITGGTAACTDTASVDLVVLASPTVSFNTTAPIGCDTLTVAFTNTSGVASTWHWDFGNGDTSNLQNPPPEFYASPNTYNVVLTATSANGCVDTHTETVEVFQTPTAGFTVTNLCEEANAQFTDTSLFALGDPIVGWNWDFGDGVGTSTQQNPIYAYQDSGMFTVTIIVNTANCSDTDSVVLNVDPKPIADFTPDTSQGCSPLVINFNNLSIGATTYNWDFGDGSTSTQPFPSHTFTNNQGTDTTYIVQLIVETPFGCSDTIIDSITVFPIPNAGFTSDAVLDCAPLVVNFTDTSSGGIGINWDFGDSTGSILPNPSHVFQNQTLFITNYTVQQVITSVTGCTDTATEIVTVYPEPIFGFSSNPDSGCSPLTVTFPSVIGAVTYQWDFGDGTTGTGPTPTHTFSNTTTNDQVFTVELIATSSFGCSDTNTGDVVVHPNPASLFTVDIDSGCHPLSVTFQNNSTGAVVYSWNFGDGNTSSSTNTFVPHTFLNTTLDTLFFTTTLIAESAEGCMDTSQVQVDVYPDIVAGLTPSIAEGCHPLDVTFTNTSVNAAQYSWDFGDGSPIDTNAAPQHIFTNTGSTTITYQVKLLVTSTEGCTDSIFQNIIVFPKPVAAINPDITVGCQPLEVNIQNNSQLNAQNEWSFGDGNISTSNAPTVTHIYTNLTPNIIFNTLELIVTSVDGCTDTVQETIEVYPHIISSFTADTVGCSPLNLSFTNNSVNGTQYDWDFGDGNTDTNIAPSHVFVNPMMTDTTYTITLIATTTEGCKDTSTLDILIHPKPFSGFTVNPNQVCHGLPVTLTNNSQINFENRWYFGFGDTLDTTGTNFDTTFFNTNPTPTTFTVTLEVETQFGCKDTSSLPLVVFPEVIADFDLPDSACTPFTVQAINQSIGEQAYSWDFGDGGFDIVENPTHTFVNPSFADTTYYVELLVTSQFSCIDTHQDTIVIHPTPVINFTATPVSQQFPASTVTITNNTNPGPWTYLWDFGDTNTSTASLPGSHEYATWGVFTIEVLVKSDFCADTATQEVEIIPPLPVASFTGLESGCRPVTIEFTNMSQYGVSYLWDFGDGSVSTQENPIYTYFNSGTYTVKLTVTGPGGDIDQITLTDIVKVYDNPLALFDFGPKRVIIPSQATNFFNFSNFSDSYLWDFGDGNTSTEVSPAHFYQEAGEFEISLIASNDFGCADTFTHEALVIAEGIGDITVPNAFVPNPSGGNGGGFDPSSLRNDIFFPLLSGVKEEGYELLIFNRWGELVFQTNDVRKGWDGYYRGNICQQDVYVWKIKAQFVNGQEVIKVGDLTLLR